MRIRGVESPARISCTIVATAPRLCHFSSAERFPEKRNFARRVSYLGHPDPGAAKFCFRFAEFLLIINTSRPGKRGERVVTNVGRDAMDAICVARRAARTRTAKSCGPGAP